jgi:hypothetical protein
LRCRTSFVDARGRTLVEMDRRTGAAERRAGATSMAAPLGGPIALPALWQRLRENAQ